MKKKGFTLIELLAVIIILALIALISTPILLNTIKNTTEKTDKTSIDLYASALKDAIARTPSSELTSGSYDTTDGKLLTLTDDQEITLMVNYNGNVVCDTIEIYEDESIYLKDCKVNGETVSYVYGTKQHLFAKDSWSEIIEVVQAGDSSVYKVGDTKEITLTGEVAGTYTVRIANTSTDDPVCSTSGYSQTACGFVIEFVDIITMNSMNSTSTNSGGWPSSSMKEYIEETIYKSLPQALQDSILETTVVSGHGSNDDDNFISKDKLYLLSTKEIWGTSKSYDSVSNETRQLDYYRDIDEVTSNYSGTEKYYNGTASYWWLRSAYSNHTGRFYVVSSSGGSGWTTANYESGVAPAFRIG